MVYTITVHLYCNTNPDSIPRLKAKLVEASNVYRKDRETVDWIVMQDVNDPRAFSIVERFEREEVSLSFSFSSSSVSNLSFVKMRLNPFK